MTALIAFPFRLDSAGAVITNEDDSDECYAGELALICMVRPEERELVPDYGTTDPAFSEFDEVEFLSQVEMYGPPVLIESVELRLTSSDSIVVDIEFESLTDMADDEEAEGEVQ